jgi:hypothetical protein
MGNKNTKSKYLNHKDSKLLSYEFETKVLVTQNFIIMCTKINYETELRIYDNKKCE